MSKYNHNRRVSKMGKRALLHRRWYSNVGDGAKVGSNPNDKSRLEPINRHYSKPGCRGIEVVGE